MDLFLEYIFETLKTEAEERRSGELLFNKYRVSVLQNEESSAARLHNVNILNTTALYT